MLHEADDGGVLEEPGFVVVAALAVALFVEGVAGAEVGSALVGGGGAGEDGEEVGPGVEGLVEFGGGIGGRRRVRGGSWVGHDERGGEDMYNVMQECLKTQLSLRSPDKVYSRQWVRGVSLVRFPSSAVRSANPCTCRDRDNWGPALTSRSGRACRHFGLGETCDRAELQRSHCREIVACAATRSSSSYLRAQ